MDTRIQIDFLQRVIGFISAGNGEFALRSIDVERGEFTVLVQPNGGRALTVQERELAQNNKIAAIKAYRERLGSQGVGLGEAKQAVEDYLAVSGYVGT